MHAAQEESRLHGLMAEFATEHEVIEAAEKCYHHGYRKMDGYSPYPIEELSEALGFHHSKVPLIVLCGGIIGCLTGFFLQYFTAAIDYPLNVGGRPLNSWPAFIPVTFEVTVLFSAFSAVIGMIALNGLPRPHHPVFNVERFSRASQDRFFLCIEEKDPMFDRVATETFLRSLNPSEVSEVEN